MKELFETVCVYRVRRMLAGRAKEEEEEEDEEDEGDSFMISLG